MWNNKLLFVIKLCSCRTLLLIVRSWLRKRVLMLYSCTISGVGGLSLKTPLTALKSPQWLIPADTVVVIRSPGVGVLFQTRSTDTSWSREPTRDTSENAWPRPFSTRCWRWRWEDHHVTEREKKKTLTTLSANLCLSLHNKWWSFVLWPSHTACPSNRDQKETGGVCKEGKSA